MLWLTRITGMFGSYWFFYWAFIQEMVVWKKPYPDLLNMMFLVGCIILFVIPNFATKQKKEKPTELQKLQKKILHAYCPEQKEKAKKKLIEYLKKKEKDL